MAKRKGVALVLANQLLDHWPASAWQHRRLVVGVSGGADSVALLCALAEIVEPERLVAAHYNHGWRGAASDADEAFVVHLCQQLGVECLVEHRRRANTHASTPLDQNDTDACVDPAMLAKLSSDASESDLGLLQSEELARNARYEFFIRAAYETGASYVATAHTADDRVETLLHNLFRGTGLAGVASLRMFRELHKDLVLVRPLIAKPRSDVLEYLIERKQNYCIDASNADEQYARNYIRSRVLPVVRSRYAGADASLFNFSELVEEALGDVCTLAERWLAAMQVEWDAYLNRVAYASNPAIASWRDQAFWGAPAGALTEQPWTIVREALRLVWLQRNWPLGDMSRRHWESLRSLIQSTTELPSAEDPSGAPQTLAMLPGALAVEAAGGYLAIGRKSARRP